MFTSPFDEKKSRVRVKKKYTFSCVFVLVDLSLSPYENIGIMCLSPLRKQNPAYRATLTRSYIPSDARHKPFSFKVPQPFSFREDPTAPYINIPCGHCSECVAMRQQSFVQRVVSESRYNHLFFATLTYDDKHLPQLCVELPVEAKPYSGALNTQRSISTAWELFDFCEETFGSEVPDAPAPVVDYLDPDVETQFQVIPYADIHDLQLMFKRMRDNNTLGRPFRYLAVSERGKTRGRPHFHILFFIPKHKNDTAAICQSLNEELSGMLLKYWSKNIGTRKNPVYERNFTKKSRWYQGHFFSNFDCHYVDPNLTSAGTGNVAFYVTKYMFKESSKESELRKMLFKYLHNEVVDGSNTHVDLTDFYSVWDIVKSRVVCSKGLGLDSVCITDIKTKPTDPMSTLAYAEMVSRELSAMQDLPPDNYVFPSIYAHSSISKHRRFVPNAELVGSIRRDSLSESRTGSGRLVFVNYDGKLSSLCKYYQDRCLTDYEFMDVYYYCKPENMPDITRADKITRATLDNKGNRYAKACQQIDSHDWVDDYLADIEESGRSTDPLDEFRSLNKLINPSSPKIHLGK